ncbi:hypothetical protein CSAL01_11204 [Colletotrichum salicis]|uniref:Uncharacterized protein n=1 Tax=Colletotrichum salicis TaxID=1209931 RepID=A0A135UM65_9PEZI|nr:hypothetical protein CSAL01_11204 [Colletotrichum salicis]
MWDIYLQMAEKKQEDIERLKRYIAKLRTPRLRTRVIDEKDLPDVIHKRLYSNEKVINVSPPAINPHVSLRECVDARRALASSNQALASSRESLATSMQVLTSCIEADVKARGNFVARQVMASFNLVTAYRAQRTVRPVPEFFDVGKDASQARVSSQTSNAHVDVVKVAQTSRKVIQVSKSTQTADFAPLSFSAIVISPLSTAPIIFSPVQVRAVQVSQPTQDSGPEPLSLSPLATSPSSTPSVTSLPASKEKAPAASSMPSPSTLSASKKIVLLAPPMPSPRTPDEKVPSTHNFTTQALQPETTEKITSPGISAEEVGPIEIVAVQSPPKPTDKAPSLVGKLSSNYMFLVQDKQPETTEMPSPGTPAPAVGPARIATFPFPPKIADTLPSLVGELSSKNMFLVQAKKLVHEDRVDNVFAIKTQVKAAVVAPTFVLPPSEVTALPAPVANIEPSLPIAIPPVSQSPVLSATVNSPVEIDEAPKMEGLHQPVINIEQVPVAPQAPKAAPEVVLATPVIITGLLIDNVSAVPDNEMEWTEEGENISRIDEPESDKEDELMEEDSFIKDLWYSDIEDDIEDNSPPLTPSHAPHRTESAPEHQPDVDMIEAPQIPHDREVDMDEATNGDDPDSKPEEMDEYIEEEELSPPVHRPMVQVLPAPEAVITDVTVATDSGSKLEKVPEDEQVKKASPPIFPAAIRFSPTPELVEVDKVPVTAGPEPELENLPEDDEVERFSPSVSPAAKANSTPEAVKFDKVPVAAVPKPQGLKQLTKDESNKKYAHLFITPRRLKPALPRPSSSPRPNGDSPGAIVIQAPDNWNSKVKAETGSKLVLLPASSLKASPSPRTNLPLNGPRPRQNSPAPKTTIEPETDVPGEPADQPPFPTVTHTPEPSAQSVKASLPPTTTTEPESEVPGEPEDQLASPTVPQTPEPPVTGSGLLTTPSIIPGLSWSAPPPPMPPVREQQTLVLRDPSPEPEAVPESDYDSDSSVEFLGIDEYIPPPSPRKILPLRRRRLALALGPAPAPSFTPEAPPRSPSPESEALSEIDEVLDDEAMSEDDEFPKPRKVLPLRRRRVGDEQRQRAQAEEHELRKKQLQEEQDKLDKIAARFRPPPSLPNVPDQPMTPTSFLGVALSPAPAVASPTLLAVDPSLTALLVVVIGSPEVENELKRTLEPLWDLIDANQIKKYGVKSLTMLAMKKWGELMEDKRYGKGQTILCSMFDDLVEKWADKVVTETFVDHLIVLNDPESQDDIMDPWLEKIREARKN